ncbi:unnamed protein product [Arctia plantaginis]|uniref:Zinc finger PHD-type domain-containing protein n=1 Tax=Arctia plantaginis TaxID=874455 RepID=A0A8S0YW14_ARCPL|nr:unnamed protein product [Arctia plantaginis]
MDETGLQLNNRPAPPALLAEKGSKAVSMTTSTEKGETTTVIGCCNAEGVFSAIYAEPHITLLAAIRSGSSAENAITGFKACGVFPLNPRAIPEYAFVGGSSESMPNLIPEMTAIQIETTAVQHEAIFQPETTTFASQLVEEPVANTSSDPGPSGSFEGLVVSTLSNPGPSGSKENYTPSRILKDNSSVPQKVVEARKRSKQVALLLTSEAHIKSRKIKEKEKTIKETKRLIKVEKNNINHTKDQKVTNKPKARKRKAIRRISETSCDEEDVVLCSDTENMDDEVNNCKRCGENHYKTKLVEDWIQCLICELWVHENCTEFEDVCSECGQKKKIELIAAKTKGKGKGIGKRSAGHLSHTTMAKTSGHAGRDGQT